jgi:hypothetical protein
MVNPVDESQSFSVSDESAKDAEIAQLKTENESLQKDHYARLDAMHDMGCEIERLTEIVDQLRKELASDKKGLNDIAEYFEGVSREREAAEAAKGGGE